MTMNDITEARRAGVVEGLRMGAVIADREHDRNERRKQAAYQSVTPSIQGLKDRGREVELENASRSLRVRNIKSAEERALTAAQIAGNLRAFADKIEKGDG